MSTAFETSCPSCDGRVRARADWAGRPVRCKHCKAVFTLPSPGEAESDAYDLADPVAEAPPPAFAASGGESTFTASYRDAPLPDAPRDRPSKRRRERPPREEMAAIGQDVRFPILAGMGGVVALLSLAAFAVPGFGVVGGWMLVGIGLAAVAVGFLVGAYAAFREDSLYGIAYLVFPIYSGYYLVTRFDDLWPWFSASTIGFVSFLIGSKALELSGAF